MITKRCSPGKAPDFNRKSRFLRLFVFLLFLTEGMPVGAQLKVDVGYRPRLEVRHGYKRLANNYEVPAVFISQRMRLSWYYETDKLRMKFTPQDVRVWGDEQLASSTAVYGDSSSLDLVEAYVAIRTGIQSWLSIGRQQLAYDNQRLLASRNWNQNGLAYDAVVFKLNSLKWKFHLGASWNSTAANDSNNYYAPERLKALSFIWLHHQFSDRHYLSFLHLMTGQTDADHENTLHFRQTSGVYAVWETQQLNFRGDVYYQYGKNQNGQHVSACLFDAEAICPGSKLTVGTGLSYLSGDRYPSEAGKTDHLFDPLYGGRHRFYGGMDYFCNFRADTNRGGLADYFVSCNYKISTKTILSNTGHYFQLAQTNGNTSEQKCLGYENDLLLNYQFASWGMLESGCLFFFPTRSLEQLQGKLNSKFSQFFYLQLTITPSISIAQKNNSETR